MVQVAINNIKLNCVAQRNKLENHCMIMAAAAAAAAQQQQQQQQLTMKLARWRQCTANLAAPQMGPHLAR